MTLYQAIILGIIQGISEFLPISSSGHLILVPFLFGWQPHDLVFDVSLHFGTALAVIVYYFRDWLNMIKNTVKGGYKFVKAVVQNDNKFSNIGENIKSSFDNSSRLFIILIIVTVPVGLAGVLLENTVETTFRSPLFVGVMLIFVSFVMLSADLYTRKLESKNHKLIRKLSQIGFVNALIISLSQIIALIPGTSRSGITVSTAMFRKVSRDQAANFSFLLATPVILGAALLKSKDLVELNTRQLESLFIGTLVSFIVGILSIAFLVKFLKKHTLTLFIMYRILIGSLIIWLYFANK